MEIVSQKSFNLAVVGTAAPFLSWLASHIDVISAWFRLGTLIVGFFAGIFAAVYWFFVALERFKRWRRER